MFEKRMKCHWSVPNIKSISFEVAELMGGSAPHPHVCVIPITLYGIGLKCKPYKALLYIYHFSSVVDFLFEKYIVSAKHRYSWYQQRGYSEDTNGETRTRNPSVINT